MPFSCFVNVGNTCYLNAALQCLMQATALNVALDKGLPDSVSAPTVLLKEYDELRRMALTNTCVIQPAKFVHAVQSYANVKQNSTFANFNQNDLGEFIHFLIDAFHEAWSPDPPIHLHACQQMMNGIFKSPIAEQLYGVHIYLVRDAAGTLLASTPEPFFMMDIPIAGSTLADCLQAYAAPESISGWKDDAGVAHNVERRLTFARIPPVLFICLKRFDSYGHKNMTIVDIPSVLQLDVAYTLAATASHSGSTACGHYTASVLHESSWVRIDDDKVTLDPCPTKEAYVVMYLRS